MIKSKKNKLNWDCLFRNLGTLYNVEMDHVEIKMNHVEMEMDHVEMEMGVLH